MSWYGVVTKVLMENFLVFIINYNDAFLCEIGKGGTTETKKWGLSYYIRFSFDNFLKPIGPKSSMHIGFMFKFRAVAESKTEQSSNFQISTPSSSWLVQQPNILHLFPGLYYYHYFVYKIFITTFGHTSDI